VVALVVVVVEEEEEEEEVFLLARAPFPTCFSFLLPPFFCRSPSAWPRVLDEPLNRRTGGARVDEGPAANPRLRSLWRARTSTSNSVLYSTCTALAGSATTTVMPNRQSKVMEQLDCPRAAGRSFF
jgi:hypothetical protein